MYAKIHEKREWELRTSTRPAWTTRARQQSSQPSRSQILLLRRREPAQETLTAAPSLEQKQRRTTEPWRRRKPWMRSPMPWRSEQRERVRVCVCLSEKLERERECGGKCVSKGKGRKADCIYRVGKRGHVAIRKVCVLLLFGDTVGVKSRSRFLSLSYFAANVKCHSIIVFFCV